MDEEDGVVHIISYADIVGLNNASKIQEIDGQQLWQRPRRTTPDDGGLCLERRGLRLGGHPLCEREGWAN